MTAFRMPTRRELLRIRIILLQAAHLVLPRNEHSLPFTALIQRYRDWLIQVVGLVCASLALILLGGCSYLRGSPLLLTHERLVVASAKPSRRDEVQVTFLGTTTLLFDDGDTRLLVDGFFTRPPAYKVILNRRVTPNTESISRALTTWKNLSEIDAVLVAHSHYDHAMDAGLVAARANDNAQVLGSASTRNVVRGTTMEVDGTALLDERIIVMQDKASRSFGKFTVHFYESEHFPLSVREKRLIGTTIAEPFELPAKITDYGEGQTYTIHIVHEKGSAIVQASAGFRANALDCVTADIVFLGTSTPLSTDSAYIESYWHEVVTATGARRVFPIHWDNPSQPLTSSLLETQALRTLPRLIDNTIATIDQMQELGEAANPSIEVALLPLGTPVTLFAAPQSLLGSDAILTSDEEESSC